MPSGTEPMRIQHRQRAIIDQFDWLTFKNDGEGVAIAVLR